MQKNNSTHHSKLKAFYQKYPIIPLDALLKAARLSLGKTKPIISGSEAEETILSIKTSVGELKMSFPRSTFKHKIALRDNDPVITDEGSGIDLDSFISVFIELLEYYFKHHHAFPDDISDFHF